MSAIALRALWRAVRCCNRWESVSRPPAAITHSVSRLTSPSSRHRRRFRAEELNASNRAREQPHFLNDDLRIAIPLGPGNAVTISARSLAFITRYNLDANDLSTFSVLPKARTPNLLGIISLAMDRTAFAKDFAGASSAAANSASESSLTDFPSAYFLAIESAKCNGFLLETPPRRCLPKTALFANVRIRATVDCRNSLFRLCFSLSLSLPKDFWRLYMAHSLLSRSVISLIALAPLALVSTASAAFVNRSASSGEMQMNGPWHHWSLAEDFDTLVFYHDNATGTLPTNWLETDLSYYLQVFHQPFFNAAPRLVFNRWLDTGVSAWSRVGENLEGGSFTISWDVNLLAMSFSVDADDVLEIRTQTWGSFNANFEQQNILGQWITMGTWSNLGETKLFNVVVGTNYRFQLTGSALNAPSDSIFEMHLTGAPAPAPGALALLGMAGIFGGRRRR